MERYMLKDKVAVITGASYGMGQTMAELFAEEGAAVILTARGKEKLDAVVNSIRAKGGKAAGVVADVCSTEDTKTENEIQVSDDVITGADIDVAGDHVVRYLNLIFSFSYQGQDFLRPFSQNHSLFSQENFSGAFCATDEKLFAQFLFQPFQLGGKGWLRKVQRFSCRGNILLPGYREEILQYTKFHPNRLLLVCLSSNHSYHLDVAFRISTNLPTA